MNKLRKLKLNETKTLLTIHRWPNVPLACWPNVGPTRWHQHIGPLTLALRRANMLALRRADEQNYIGPTPFFMMLGQRARTTVG